MSSIQSDAHGITLLAPLKGFFVALESVPDPAFAQKMVGDGAAIDPTEGRLVAPCDGEISMVHPACHAVSMRISTGHEVLMHIGVDTVKLKGEGFDVKVEAGQQVQTGDTLIEFDLDTVAQRAASLVTPVLFTDPDQLQHITSTKEATVTPGQAFISAEVKQQTSATAVAGPTLRSSAIAVGNASGIHARPAAQLAQTAKQFGSDITLLAGQRQTNARSVVGIMGLNIGFGDSIEFEASGEDAEAALQALEQAVKQGLGEEVSEAAPLPQATAQEEPSLLFPPATDSNRLSGISASPGFAVGELYKVENSGFEFPVSSDNADAEREHLHQAMDASKQGLTNLIAQLATENNSDKQEIMAAHLELLDDPALAETSLQHIDHGSSAPAAWQQAIETQAGVLEGLANPLMQQRAIDLRDVGTRVLRQLLGLNNDPMADIPADAIVAAEELTPSEVAGLDPSRVGALLTTTGSATSHVAILARSQNIPMVAAVDNKLMSLNDDTRLMVDASAGQIIVAPTDTELTELEGKKQAAAELAAAAQKVAMSTAITADGIEIEVAANIGDVEDASKAAAAGADGIGLLRSEFLYLGRLTEPDEDAQTQAYQTLLTGIGDNKPVIVRTLDVGGDKPLPYISIPKEDNPFLGERGIRIGLDRPRLLRTQLRALLRASGTGKLRIMLPMISSLSELKLARRVLDEETRALGVSEVELGVMIEVPSAALMADVLAQEADFFSIGTNDLTQYTLAIDRGNARLAPLADNLDPAVLRMIDLTVKGARKHNRWVGVCGGMAGETLAQPLLLGLGVNELSVNIPAVAETKYRVRQLNLAECQQLAQQALSADSAAAVKALVTEFLAD